MLLTVAAGFTAGVYFNDVSPSSSPPQKPAKPNHSTYDISPPSRGAAIKTLSVPVKPTENTANVILKAEEAAMVKTGQRILLYDTNEALIEMLGEVAAITENGDDTVTIKMNFDGDSTIPSSLATRGEIVIGRETAAQRIPKSAIVMDGGLPYLWEIAANSDGTHSVYFKRANVTMETEDFIVIDNAAPGSNLFVLNPDKKLEDGQKINVRKALYAGPAQTADQAIAMAVYDRRMNQTYERAMDAARAGRSSGASNSSGCGQAPDITADFIAKIKSLAPATPRQGL